MLHYARVRTPLFRTAAKMCFLLRKSGQGFMVMGQKKMNKDVDVTTFRFYVKGGEGLKNDHLVADTSGKVTVFTVLL